MKPEKQVQPVLDFNIEPFDQWVDEVIAQCATWWDDSKFYKDSGIEYNISKEFFKSVEASLLGIMGRDKDGKLGAFYLGSVQPFMFNHEISQCSEIVWNIHDDLQGGQVLSELLISVDAFMRINNIDIWSVSLPNEDRYIRTGKTLKKYNYQLQDLQYMRYNN